MNRTLSTALVRFTRTFDKQYAAILKKHYVIKKAFMFIQEVPHQQALAVLQMNMMIILLTWKN
jgi:hypothetical protein